MLYLKKLKIIVFFSVVSFFFTLFLPYMGEEGVYTITTLEMLDSWSFFPTFMGGEYPRPPMVNWLMMPITFLVGAKNVLVASRILALLSTFGITAVLYKTVTNTYNDKNFSIFVTSCFLSGDLLMKRGWIAYSDPLFSFFIATSILILFNNAFVKKNNYLYIAPLLTICGFLCKSYIAFCFYFVAILAILISKKRNLFDKKFIFLNVLIFAFPILWYSLFVPSNHNSDMMQDMFNKFQNINILKILKEPFSLIFKFAPISLITIYCLIKYKPKIKDEFFISILLFSLLSSVPFFISGENKTRYLLPIYPFFSFLFAHVIWNFKQYINISTNLLAVNVSIKYLWIFWLAFFNVKNYGDTFEIANNVLSLTQNKKLYVNDDRAGGIGVISAIASKVYPEILIRPPVKTHDACVLNFENNENYGTVIKKYKISGDYIYILCN